jgi:hypothetical protein
MDGQHSEKRCSNSTLPILEDDITVRDEAWFWCIDVSVMRGHKRGTIRRI